MDNVTYNFKFRERYLADELTPTEKAAFEEELDRNPELRELLAEQIQLGDWIGEALDQLEEAPPAPPIPKPGIIHMMLGTWKKYPVAMAAALAVVVLGTWLLIGPSAGTHLGGQVFSANKKIYNNPELRSVKGTVQSDDPRSDDMDPALMKILRDTYAMGPEKYEEAIAQLDSYRASDQDASGKGLFYRAMAQFGLENTQKASQDLKAYLDIGTGTKYYEPAQYYLGLSLLNEDEIDAAKGYLQPLADGGGVYAGRARTVLDQLDDPSLLKK